MTKLKLVGSKKIVRIIGGGMLGESGHEKRARTVEWEKRNKSTLTDGITSPQNKHSSELGLIAIKTGGVREAQRVEKRSRV